MIDLVLISRPTAEPVSVADMLIELELPVYADDNLATALSTKLTGYIAAARSECETYTRRNFITRRWLMKLDGFPRPDMRYESHWQRHAILLPKQPFQSIEFVQYVDTTGALVELPQDTDYGNAGTPAYAYQLDPGSDHQPARVGPSWLQPWPPTRMVQSNVLVQFKAGYGAPAKVSMDINSAILVGPVFDPGDVGQAVSVPAAGANATNLCSTVASVDVDGQATLADEAVAAVSGVNAWIGNPVPESILLAIKFLASFYYQQTAVVDQPLPRVVRALLDPYRNLVS